MPVNGAPLPRAIPGSTRRPGKRCQARKGPREVTTEPHGPDELLAPPAIQLRKATLAVYAIFIVNGFAFASWASRIPQFRDELGVNPAQLGLILLSAALGSLVALPLSGLMVTRLGESRAIVVMSMLLAAGLVVAGIGATHGMFPVIVGLALIGFGNAVWDVAMNVHAALVEKHLGRAIMPRFHAGFSVGTVVGALLGSVIVAAGVGISPHLVLVAAVVAVTIPATIRFFLPGRHAAPTHPGRQPAQPVPGLDRAPHVVDRGLRAVHGVYRGHRERLARPGHDRWLRRCCRSRIAHLRDFRRRDDRGSVVRTGLTRPSRTRAPCCGDPCCLHSSG